MISSFKTQKLIFEFIFTMKFFWSFCKAFKDMINRVIVFIRNVDDEYKIILFSYFVLTKKIQSRSFNMQMTIFIVLISIHNHECFSISLSILLSTTRHSTRRQWRNSRSNSFLFIKFLFKCFLWMSIEFLWNFWKWESFILFFFSTIKIWIKRRNFSMITEFSSNQYKTRHERNEIYSKNTKQKSSISRWVFRRTRIFYSFFSRRLKFESSEEIFQRQLNFHQIKTKLDIKEMKYILKMQNKSRAFRVESFVESIFFYSRRRSRMCFFEKKSNLKACYDSMFIISKLDFY
jgi:hypothetical protein